MAMVQTQNENAKFALNLLRVDGPVSYSCWVYRNKKDEPTLIHNFGDIHVHGSGCSTMNNNEDPFMSIEELIAGTMHHAHINNRTPLDKSIIDFFLEDARHECYRTIYKQSRSEMLNQGALNRLEREFAPCLCLTDMKNCRLDFPAGRIHASDIRLVLGFAGGPVVKDWPEIEDKRSDTWKRFKYTIANQIHHVVDKKIQNKLFKMFYQIKALSREELQKNSYAPLMDIYLLGRLFRSYEPLIDQNPKSAFHNAPVQNAVIYSGDHHKNIYDIFFRKIGATLLYSFNGTYISPEVGLAQCVKIPIFLSARKISYLPMVSDFGKNSIIYGNINNLNFVSIETEYDKFKNLNTQQIEDSSRNYAIEREEEKEVKLLRPSQTLFYGQNLPIRKYPKIPRSEEPQAKRQRIGGKEEEP